MVLTTKEKNQIRREVEKDFARRRLVVEEKIFNALNSKKKKRRKR